MLNLGAVWGLDVGDSALKAVKLKRMGNRIALLDYQIIRYGDLAGEVGARREGRLPEAIASFMAAAAGRDRCFVSIAPQAVFSRFISLPPVDKRRIPEIVLYEARQQIPFSLNEVVWAYESVRKDFVPGEEIEIGLFAVKREVVDAYLGELGAIRQRVQGIQVAPLALYNFIRHEMSIEQPVVAVDVGAQSTDLLIIEGKKFWLRNLPIAGNSFTSVLEKRLNISRAEAEKLKLEVADNRQRRKILEVLRPAMRDLVAEIQRSVGYYKSLSQSVKLDEVLVTGEGFKLFGLDKYLAEQLQYKITPLNQLKNIVYQGPQERLHGLEKELSSLGVAIGLALQGLGQGRATVNLLPDSFIIERELRAKRYSAFVAAALVWAAALSFYANENKKIAELKSSSITGDTTLNKVQKNNDEWKRLMAGEDPRIPVFEAFGKHRLYDAQIIKAISEVIPQDIRVDNGFTFSASADAGMAGLGLGSGKAIGLGPKGAAAADAEGAGGSADAAALRNAKMVLTFDASCDESLFDSMLKIQLPKYLKQAAVYWRQVPVVTGVTVGDVNFRYTMVPDPLGPGTIKKTELTAQVRVALLTAEEVDAAIAAADKKKSEEEETARGTAAEAGGAAAPASPAAPHG